MADYKDMYFKTFNKLTDIISELKVLQTEMEEDYINLSPEENGQEVTEK